MFSYIRHSFLHLHNIISPFGQFVKFCVYISILTPYPKSERFVLVEEIKRTLYSGLRLLVYALKIYNKQEKLKYLNELDACLKLLQVHIRISFKYKYISMQNYSTWSDKLTEVCKMLGGWISSCLKK